jgi:plastocyanin
MKDTKYLTESLDSGQSVSVFITNSDPTAHTFTIDGNVDQAVPAKSSGKVTLSLKPGQYHYYCSVPGHKDTMHGTLTVR